LVPGFNDKIPKKLDKIPKKLRSPGLVPGFKVPGVSHPASESHLSLFAYWGFLFFGIFVKGLRLDCWTTRTIFRIKSI